MERSDKATERLINLVSSERKPFMLSGREAHHLIDAIETERAALMSLNVPQEGPEDAEADSEVLARLHDVSQRLYEFCGYERKPRA